MTSEILHIIFGWIFFLDSELWSESFLFQHQHVVVKVCFYTFNTLNYLWNHDNLWIELHQYININCNYICRIISWIDAISFLWPLSRKQALMLSLVKVWTEKCHGMWIHYKLMPLMVKICCASVSFRMKSYIRWRLACGCGRISSLSNIALIAKKAERLNWLWTYNTSIFRWGSKLREVCSNVFANNEC